MNPEFSKVLPTILIVIDFFSAIPYGYLGDWRHCLYWVAAGVLTFCVTY